MKTLESLKFEAGEKMALWDRIVNDPAARLDRGITKEEAIRKFEYFDGQFDALCDAINIKG